MPKGYAFPRRLLRRSQEFTVISSRFNRAFISLLIRDSYSGSWVPLKNATRWVPWIVILKSFTFYRPCSCNYWNYINMFGEAYRRQFHNVRRVSKFSRQTSCSRTAIWTLTIGFSSLYMFVGMRLERVFTIFCFLSDWDRGTNLL